MTSLNKKEIESLLPHRDPMLLIESLQDIKKLTSATGLVKVKKDSFFVQGHFPDQPVMPGVLIVEAFGQTAAALTAHGIDKSTYENKLVFLMGVEKARFRNPVIPDCDLLLKIQAIRSHGRVWKYKGEAFGQTAAALTAHGIDKSTYENKLVFLMGVEKARFRNPVIPDCELLLKIEAIRSHGRVWKYKGEAFVDDKKMADAIWSATIVYKK